MHKVLLATDERTSFPWQAFLLLSVCVLTLLAAPLRGQDDNGAAMATLDNGAAQAQPDNTAPSAPDANAATGPVQDAGGAAPDEPVTFQTFYDALGSMGTWIQSADYGYVWQPQVNDPDWAPYTDGHWVYTDDGWTWDSDEPWGWATYHYGRWVNLDGYGWCWVPGYVWAPAWVSWRFGDGFAGWAPLPPDSFVGVDYSDNSTTVDTDFHIGGDCDGFYGIGPAYYIFLPVNCLCYRHYHGYYCHRGDNFGLINRTTNVTNINVARHGHGANFAGGTSGGGRFHRVTTGGPSLAQINAVSSSPMSKLNLVHTHERSGGALTGNSLAVYAPHVNPGTDAHPSQVNGSIGQAAKINRGTDILQPLAVNSRMTPAPATEAQVQQARIAQNHAPASAKVVTDSASVTPILQAPLTTLKPTARTVAPPTVYNTTPNSVMEHTPSNGGGVNPTARIYPQTEPNRTPSHVYQPGQIYTPAPSSFHPHPTTTTVPVGGAESHTYIRPTAPAVAPQPAPNSTSTYHSGGGNPGGSSGGSSNSGGGGTSHTQSSGSSSSSGGGNGGGYNGGGGGGGFHGGGGNPPGH